MWRGVGHKQANERYSGAVDADTAPVGGSRVHAARRRVRLPCRPRQCATGGSGLRVRPIQCEPGSAFRAWPPVARTGVVVHSMDERSGPRSPFTASRSPVRHGPQGEPEGVAIVTSGERVGWQLLDRTLGVGGSFLQWKHGSNTLYIEST
jgi:hypothetical protein